ncbi:hypothetical protein [Actinomadura chokoriensis]|uniref:hypothetical protein n=1 Tax=Actinomadura chokoriensis TaxID=454156 RepID=UPI0031F85ED8
MTLLRLSYVNVEHGGRTDAGYSAYSGDGGPYDYNRVTGMFHDGDVRHEALCDRAEVKDHRHRLVAAGREKLRAARLGERRERREQP